MTGEPVSDPYLARRRAAEQSIVNAPVRDQLAAIANWHDSENPSRMALGAVASCALNHINSLEAEVARLRVALHKAWDRMDTARSILTDDKPTLERNWGMLDTTLDRRALSAEGERK